MNDLFFCGYNWQLDAFQDAPAQHLKNIATVLIRDWKANFIRIGLSMHDYKQVSWTENPDEYKNPMIEAIDFIGSHPGVYVLVTLRSDKTMIMTDPGNGSTYIPTKDTDNVYRALVNSFANDKHVIFGICNEPGHIEFSDLEPVMSHAVKVIRNEEDRLGVPHHLIAVQGRMWTSDISFYNDHPLPYDNVVYEVHGYQSLGSFTTKDESFTYSNIPVIVGEYGLNGDGGDFYADIEDEQIPNLAWNFEPYSNCRPDLLEVNYSSTDLVPTAWGQVVKDYLLTHAAD
jgi:hypothetical protein